MKSRVQRVAVVRLWLALTLMVLSSCARAASVSLAPDRDTTLIEYAPTNSAGGADFFTAGTTQNRSRNRALIRFQIAGVIPSNAVITSAALTLEVIRVPAESSPASVFALRRVLRDWGEGGTQPDYTLGNGGGGWGGLAATNDATWMARFAFTTNSWTSPGGTAGSDYAAAFSSSMVVEMTGSYLFESTLDMVADVQRWLDHPAQNFGWMLASESEDVPFTARKFGSRENTDSGPSLAVDYIVRPYLNGARAMTNHAVFQFTAEPGQSYVVEGATQLLQTNWTALLSFPPPPQTTNITVLLTMSYVFEFYRVRTLLIQGGGGHNLQRSEDASFMIDALFGTLQDTHRHQAGHDQAAGERLHKGVIGYTKSAARAMPMK